MAEIVRIYRESLPAVRLIGRRYPGATRAVERYTSQWEEWLSRDLFAPIRRCGLIEPEGDAYIGSMRVEDGALSYWIGMFTPEGTVPPAGYSFLDIPAGDIGVVWLKGPDDWNLYRRHDQCAVAMQRQGWSVPTDASFFERYTQSRFARPARDGTVILDYCVHL